MTGCKIYESVTLDIVSSHSHKRYIKSEMFTDPNTLAYYATAVKMFIVKTSSEHVPLNKLSHYCGSLS